MMVPSKNEPNGLPGQQRAAEADCGCRIVELPHRLCHTPPGNPEITMDDVRQLHDSMAKHGQLVDAIAAPHPDMPGHYLIPDGNGRLAACRALDIPLRRDSSTTCPTRPSSITIRLTTATIRKSMDRASVGADALRWMKLTGANQAEAAEHFGYKSQGSISKLIAPFENGLEELVEALKERQISGSAAYLVAQLPPEAQRRALPGIIGKRLPRKRVESIVAELKGKKAKVEKLLKLAHAGMSATVRKGGGSLESVKAFCAKRSKPSRRSSATASRPTFCPRSWDKPIFRIALTVGPCSPTSAPSEVRDERRRPECVLRTRVTRRIPMFQAFLFFAICGVVAGGVAALRVLRSGGGR